MYASGCGAGVVRLRLAEVDPYCVLVTERRTRETRTDSYANSNGADRRLKHDVKAGTVGTVGFFSVRGERDNGNPDIISVRMLSDLRRLGVSHGAKPRNTVYYNVV